MQIINLTNTLFRAKPSYCKLKPESNVNIKENFYIDVNNFLNGKCNAYDYLTNFKNNLRALKNCKDFNIDFYNFFITFIIVKEWLLMVHIR